MRFLSHSARGVVFGWLGIVVSVASAADPKPSKADSPAAEAALKRIAELGGVVKRDDKGSAIEVNLFERQTTNADIKLMTALADVQKLYLWGAEIDDEGLSYLPAYKKLRDLTLENTGLTDDGLKHLSGMKSLTS